MENSIDMDVNAEAVNSIGGIDIGVIIVYIVGIIAVGCWAGMRNKNKEESAKDYFLAGGTLKWPAIGLALFATNISTVHLVSLAQTGFDEGLLSGNYEWMAVFTLVILGVFFAPFYIRSKVTTLPDFLEKRYSRTCRDWLAVMSVVSAIAIHIAFALYTGAVVLKGMFGFPILYSVIGVAILTGIYTVVGGLMAVVLTESIQTIVLLLGACFVTYFCWTKLGSSGESVIDLITSHAQIKNDSGEVIDSKLSMLKSGGHSPWYAFLLGFPVLGIWYWCADQTIVQRVLGAKDENHARVGSIFAGFIKILPVFIFILPGLMFYAIIQQGIIPESAMPTKLVDGKEVIDSSQTYAVMIRELLPVGLKGVVAAALLSALMSTVSGALNSISTLVSYDIYKRFKADADDQHLVKVGRIACVAATIISIIISLQLDRFGSIIQGLNTLIGYIAAPITAVFVMGVFWKKASAKAAVTSLALGFVISLVLMIFSFTGITIPVWSEVPFLMQAFYLCAFYMILIGIISTLNPHEHTVESEKLYWKTPFEALQGEAWKGVGNYKSLSGVLICIMIVLFYTFR
ncbi:sodium/glucose cotransporter 2 [Lentisphaera araneosa HTCC2155]|uniref:Sodium/glucose cotransporter 2 n=1 Tax=Lentisphaera araneosa HTCC2155 TaxID=313628 RepID=A6DTQ5_9BACT|nr:sodium:solute symporter [Lentisphaera araneosa]EDM24982.1 sodium/glucose cotransporter 2 [Lentisphaera araneosa HTCC2155]